MMAGVPDAAKELAQKIQKQEGQVQISTKDMKATSTGDNLNSNDAGWLRRSISFATKNENSRIVPVRMPEGAKNPGGALAYQTMSKESFEGYRFSENNFNTLTNEDVENIIDRIRSVYPDIGNDKIFPVLTICDIIVQFRGRDNYIPTRIRTLACSLLTTKEKVQDILMDMEKLGIVTQFKRTIRFNTIFKDAIEATKEKEQIEKELQDRKENPVHSLRRRVDNRKAVAKPLNKILDIVDDYEDQLAKARHEIEQLKTRIRLDEKNTVEARKITDTYGDVLASYKKLQEEDEDLRRQLEQYKQAHATLNRYRQAMKKNADIVLSKLLSQAMYATMEYSDGGNVDVFKTAIMTAMSDAKSSITSAILYTKVDGRDFLKKKK